MSKRLIWLEHRKVFRFRDSTSKVPPLLNQQQRYFKAPGRFKVGAKKARANTTFSSVQAKQAESFALLDAVDTSPPLHHICTLAQRT